VTNEKPVACLRSTILASRKNFELATLLLHMEFRNFYKAIIIGLHNIHFINCFCAEIFRLKTLCTFLIPSKGRNDLVISEVVVAYSSS